MPKINLELIYSRNEFNDKIGWNSPVWMAGMANKNTIYLFSPLVIEKVSTHKKSKLSKIIAHELCHLFHYKINKNMPTLFDEGLALFLANQKKLKPEKSEWSRFIDDFSLETNNYRSLFAMGGGYKLSYWLIRMLARKLTKNELRDLIKINPKKENMKIALKKLLRSSTTEFF